MRNSKLIYLIGILMGVMVLTAPAGWTQPKSETRGPIITHAFAVEKGKYGYVWKIYIEAEDPDGEMLSIASVVDQPAAGRYPTDWVYLKPQYGKHFKGYLQWNTFSTKAANLREWTYITLRVSVVDKAGNASNEVVFPFSFESGVEDQYKYILPAPFDEGNLQRLGYIGINLFDPTLRKGRGGGS